MWFSGCSFKIFCAVVPSTGVSKFVFARTLQAVLLSAGVWTMAAGMELSHLSCVPNVVPPIYILFRNTRSRDGKSGAPEGEKLPDCLKINDSGSIKGKIPPEKTIVHLKS